MHKCDGRSTDRQGYESVPSALDDNARCCMCQELAGMNYTERASVLIEEDQTPVTRTWHSFTTHAVVCRYEQVQRANTEHAHHPLWCRPTATLFSRWTIRHHDWHNACSEGRLKTRTMMAANRLIWQSWRRCNAVIRVPLIIAALIINLSFTEGRHHCPFAHGRKQ